MKGFVITAALGLFIGTHALPTPGGGASPQQGQGQGQNLDQMLKLLQTSGLSNSDLSALLETLGAQNAGAGEGAAAQEDAAAKEEAAAVEQAAANEAAAKEAAAKEAAAMGNEAEAVAGGEAAAGEGEAAAVEGEAAAGEGEAAAGEGEAANEKELEAAFGAATAVEGGDIKQDLVFTPSTVGKFEFEFQNDVADEVTVTENTTPNGVAPEGFEFLETSSFTVALAVSKGEGLTLSKIDYIFDTAAAGLEGKDITTSKVGRLCAETGSFVISEALGEVEFEVEENEVTLNLNKAVTAEAEWGIFIPVAAAAAGEAAAGEAAAGEAVAGEEAAAAEGAAKEEAAAQEGAAAHEAAAAEGAAAEGAAADAHEAVAAEGENAAAAAHAKKVEEQAAKVAEAEAMVAAGASGEMASEK